MVDEIVNRTRYIDKKYCSIHPSPDNLPGKFEPFLSGGAKNMDMVPIHQHSPEIKCCRRRTTRTIRFHVAGLRVEGLYQRGFPCSKCPEDYNLAFLIVSHYEKVRRAFILPFR